MVRNLTQLAPLLRRLASLELGLDTANAAVGLGVLQQLHSLHRLKLSTSNPARKLRLQLAALRLLPSSLTELNLNFVPALGEDALANVFPTVCLQNLRKLVLHFGTVPQRVKEAEPFQATDAICPLLTWLEVVGPNPCAHDDSESELEEGIWAVTLSAQFSTRFPAIQTLHIAEGHVSGFCEAIEDMPHLTAARLHLDTHIWMPSHHHLQILQLNLRDNADESPAWGEHEWPEYDLSAMPNLIWALLIGPCLGLPIGVPRSLSKLLLVSFYSTIVPYNGSDDDKYRLLCDLSSLDLLALITVQEQCHVWSGGFSGPRLFLHEGDPTCDAAFPSDVKWYILMVCSTALNNVAEHPTAQVDGYGSNCRCDGGGAHLLPPFARSN